MRTLNDYFSCEIADISQHHQLLLQYQIGKIIKIITSLQGAISGANAIISFEIGGTAVTGGGTTVAHSGSAGTLIQQNQQQPINRRRSTIEMITDGGSTELINLT